MTLHRNRLALRFAILAAGLFPAVVSAADAPANRDLMLEAYERHPEAFTSSPSEYVDSPMTRWVDRLPPGDNPHSLVLGAFDDAGRLVGVAGLSVEDKIKARHKGTLFGMYVVPAARAQGLGAQLVQGVLEFLAARGYPDAKAVHTAEESLIFALPPELRKDMRAAEKARG